MGQYGRAPSSYFYELRDPRPGRLETYISWGTGFEPWKRLQATPGGPLAAWLEELRALGLEPVRDRKRCLSCGLVAFCARKLALNRRQQAREWGQLVLSNRRPRNEYRKPVMRRMPDGSTQQYGSIREAGRLTGMTHVMVWQLLQSGRPDRTGGVWLAC